MNLTWYFGIVLPKRPNCDPGQRPECEARRNHKGFGKKCLIRFLVIASWYHLVDRCLLREARRQQARIVILDGWWYRHVAKTALRTNMSPRRLGSLFETLTLKPQRRLLLDVPPAIAWRRKSFREHEIGYWDGLEHLDPEAAFIRYQAAVHDTLIEVEDVVPWTVVSAAASDGEGAVADRILEVISEDLA